MTIHIDLSDIPVPELLVRFEDAAAVHGQCIMAGDSEFANRCYDKMDSISDELAARGQLISLIEFLENPDPSVRLWAATHSLGVGPSRAEATLLELEKGPPSPIRLTAEMNLQAWRRGEFKSRDT